MNIWLHTHWCVVYLFLRGQGEHRRCFQQYWCFSGFGRDGTYGTLFRWAFRWRVPHPQAHSTRRHSREDHRLGKVLSSSNTFILSLFLTFIQFVCVSGCVKVSRSSSSVSLKPLWNTPTPADSSSVSEPYRTTELRSSINHPYASSSSAPPSPSHGSKHSPPFPISCPSLPPPAPSSAPPLPPAPSSAPPLPPAHPSTPPPPPPPQAFQDRPTIRPPPLPSCPPPPPPFQVTKPTWLPIQHTSISHPSTPPPPPPSQPPSAVPGDRSSGCFYPPPPSPVHSEPSRLSIQRDTPLGPPPPPPPPLPTSFIPTCPSTLPPPPPKTAPVSSSSMRTLPPSYPCNAPTRRPPAVPRSAGKWHL